jgi:pyruvate dehydrogenase E2 component (dihydrolipoamide acetyltransferase)
MESGTISKWNVAEGDSFSAGDSLAVVETDKASMDFEAQDDGVVARLLVSAGTENVSVGAAIMVTVEDAADVGAFVNFSAGASPSSASAAATPAAAATAAPTPPPAEAVAVTAAPSIPPSAAIAAAAVPTTPPAAVAPPAAAPPAPASRADSLGGSEWGRLAAQKSPLAKMMAIKQREYVEKYGSTGHAPVV